MIVWIKIFCSYHDGEVWDINWCLSGGEAPAGNNRCLHGKGRLFIPRWRDLIDKLVFIGVLWQRTKNCFYPKPSPAEKGDGKLSSQVQHFLETKSKGER